MGNFECVVQVACGPVSGRNWKTYLQQLWSIVQDLMCEHLNMYQFPRQFRTAVSLWRCSWFRFTLANTSMQRVKKMEMLDQKKSQLNESKCSVSVLLVGCHHY
jgi:hypothetical protein